MIMVTYAYICINAWTCAKTDQRNQCWRLLLMPCFEQMLNPSVMLVPCVICALPSSSSIIYSPPITYFDRDLWDWRSLSPLWPLCMMDPMLFCVSALSCATKIAEALILLGQENQLVLVPDLRWVGFWSLDLSGRLPTMFGPDCGYPP